MIILNTSVTISRKMCQLAYLVVRDGNIKAVNYNFITDLPTSILPVPAGAISFSEASQAIRDDLQNGSYFVGHDVLADIDGLATEFAQCDGWVAPQNSFCTMTGSTNFCALPYGPLDTPRPPTLPELLTRLELTSEAVTLWATETWGRKIKKTVPGGWQDSRWNVAAIYCVLRAMATDNPYLLPSQLDEIKNTAWVQGLYFDPHPKELKKYSDTLKKRRLVQMATGEIGEPKH